MIDAQERHDLYECAIAETPVLFTSRRMLIRHRGLLPVRVAYQPIRCSGHPACSQFSAAFPSEIADAKPATGCPYVDSGLIQQSWR
jgi:hypothetical protein